VLAANLDPDGRCVVFTENAWRHIVEKHPELEPFVQQIVTAVRAPSRRVPGRKPGEEWFYLAEAGPSRWLKVVVHYEGDEGEIVTAFARRAFP
jgi:hypothetical protein